MKWERAAYVLNIIELKLQILLEIVPFKKDT